MVKCSCTAVLAIIRATHQLVEIWLQYWRQVPCYNYYNETARIQASLTSITSSSHDRAINGTRKHEKGKKMSKKATFLENIKRDSLHCCRVFGRDEKINQRMWHLHTPPSGGGGRDPIKQPKYGQKMSQLQQ